MKLIATFDIGTTNVKGVLVDILGNPIYHESRSLETLFPRQDNSFKEQNPKQWYQAFCEISQCFFNVCSSEDIIGIILSGQMQDLILVDSHSNPVMNAILYSDGRAQEEADEIINCIGCDSLVELTGNAFDGSRPLSKLKWVKKQLPDVYEKAAHVLISSKDYVITKLTGEYVSDVISCSTAGLMDIEKKQWCFNWLRDLDLTHIAWPKICFAHEKAGYVVPSVVEETGYLAGTAVYAGTGDAGSATLASGISKENEFNINLGTSGWIACTSKNILRKDGVSNLSAMPENLYINVVPFFNAGNVHQWISNLIFEDNPQKEQFLKTEELLLKSKPASEGLLFLPYLVGERFPIMDSEVAGCFVDIRPHINKADMARAALEGVAYSIRQGMDAIGKKPTKLSLVGGGAQSGVWCQILADMMKMPLSVFRNAEFLPSNAIAASVLIDQGYIKSYSSFTDALQSKEENSICYYPNINASLLYDHYYPRFCSIYKAVKTLTAKIE